ncbi:hypothetical protein HWI79_1452 [Cryptosporidium felis]|nr:hypothetical protein HWI79_1452 [Cryptosporidium felis]
MFELKKILTQFGHPIIRNRIENLEQEVHNVISGNPTVSFFNLFYLGVETIFDFDGFFYKLYFSSEKKQRGVNNEDSKVIKDRNHFRGNSVQFLRNKSQSFYLVLEVYSPHLTQLWNDAQQLVEYYRNIASNEIEIIAPQESEICLLIYIPNSFISKSYTDSSFTSKRIAFEMITSSIRSCLYCGSILNIIRYVSYYNSQENSGKSSDSQIENYSLLYKTLINKNAVHAYYPDTQTKESFVLLVFEFYDTLTNENALAYSFIQELLNAINQGKAQELLNKGRERITIAFSNSLPKSINEFLSNQKLSGISGKKLFLIFCIPISWLHSTDDSDKLYLAEFSTLVNNLLLQMIPQCKSSIRCGLRKHVLELTSQESEGY